MASPEKSQRFRPLDGVSGRAVQILCVALALACGAWSLGLQTQIGLLLYQGQLLAFVLGVTLAAVFLLVPATKSSRFDRVAWYDWLLAILALAPTAYLIVNFQEITLTFSRLTPERWVLGGLLILLVCEATRRLLGWSLVIILAVFVLYALFADHFPGYLNAPATSWKRLITYMYLDPSALIGVPLAVAATIIAAFIFFGKMLAGAGGDHVITDLAYSLMGHRRGGAAKVSIVASTLFGTVSGSAISNVALVGPISIPMMRQNGYPAATAAAIEAVASTGGQIMPPVMGITAFLIADFLGIPFAQVAVASLLPAILYYLAVFVQVDVEAAKHNLSGLPKSELPRLGKVAREGWLFILPLLLLFYTIMFAAWDPGKAGMAASFLTMVVWMVRSGPRALFKRLCPMLVEVGRTMLDIVILTALAGLIIGALSASGLTFSFSNILLGIAGERLLPLLLMTGFTCFVLGMGMPTAVIYVMLAVLVGPVFERLDVIPLAAHLFLFYMGMLSMITPPVCLAVFTAAAIAQADMWKTGFIAMRLGAVAYIVPFVFVYSPGLLMMGSWINIFLAVVTATIGILFLCWALSGWITRQLALVPRLCLALCGLAAMPSPTAGGWILAGNVIGLLCGGAIVAYEVLVQRRNLINVQQQLQANQ